MSTSTDPILIVAEPSGDLSATSIGLASSVLPADSPLYSYLFTSTATTVAPLADQESNLRNAAQISQSITSVVDSARFSLVPGARCDTGLRTLSGQSILLAAPVVSSDGLTYTFIGRVDSNANGSADDSEKPAVALVYQLTMVGGKPTGYTLTTLLFDVAIDHSGGDLAPMNQLVQLEVKRDLVFNDFSKAPSGQNDYIALSPTGSAGVQADGSSYHIVLTAGVAGTTQVNTSTTGVGVSDQAIDPGETIRADFLTNITAGDSKDLTTLKAGDRYMLGSAFFTISQVSPTKSKASARIELVCEANGNYSSSASELAKWSSFQVFSGSGALVAEGVAGSPKVTSYGTSRITLISSSTSTSTKSKTTTTTSGTDADTLVLGGLMAGDRVVVKGASTFNRLEVSNAGSYGFDIGSFGGTQVMGGASSLQAPAIADATPTLAMAAAAPTSSLTVNEAALGTAASASFADRFTATVSGGADGIKTTITSYSLSVASEGINSGLIDTASTAPVQLYRNGTNVVEGRVGGSTGAIAFLVSVDATGMVSLEQRRALGHGGSGTATDGELVLAAGLIRLGCSQSVLDGDGDAATAAASLDLGGALRFGDDRPSLHLAAVSTTALPELVVSEMALGTGASGSFAAQFGATITPGADGQANLSASYGLAPSSEGVESGLLDTATGSAVRLYSNGSGVVEGRVGSATGELAFSVSVNELGAVSLQQQRALRHGTPGGSTDTVLSLAGNLIQLSCSQTVTDGDGDTATAFTSIAIGTSLAFADAVPGSLQIASSQLGFLKNASGSGAISLSPGADGFGGFDASSVGVPKPITLGDGSVVSSRVSASDASSLTISGYTASGSEFYRLLLNQSGYSFSLLQPPPAIPQKLDFSSVSAGGPQETMTANQVTVDGYLYDPTKPVNTSTLQLRLASSDDDINPNSSGGIGVGNGNMDRGEGLLLSCIDPVVGYNMAVTGVGGGIGDVTFWWQAFATDGTPVSSGSQLIKLGSGKVETLQIRSNDGASKLYVYTSGMDANDVFRINNIERFTYVANPDYQLGFQVAALDGDGDRTNLAPFTVGLDGNGDSQVTNPLVF